MDTTTFDVRMLYTKFPFPGTNIQYTLPTGTHAFSYVQQLRAAEHQFANANVLDAGCGTGGTTQAVAQAFPQANVLGIDLCDRSLELARQQAQIADVHNVCYQPADLLDLELPHRFDLILCSGVLHILSQPEVGLRNLAHHLNDDGRMIVWLYGAHGRHRLNINQKLLSTLFKNVDSLERKVELTKQLLAAPESRQLLRSYFSTPNGQIDGDWEKSVDWILNQDAWIVDQFLHPNETCYTMESILDLLENAGLRLDQWLGVEEDFAALIDSQELVTLYEGLPSRDRLVVLDSLLKPHSYALALRAAR